MQAKNAKDVDIPSIYIKSFSIERVFARSFFITNVFININIKLSGIK